MFYRVLSTGFECIELEIKKKVRGYTLAFFTNWDRQLQVARYITKQTKYKNLLFILPRLNYVQPLWMKIKSMSVTVPKPRLRWIRPL